jgi:membrane fusion protein
VSLAVPISWQIIGYLLLAALATALVFLATASYSRAESVAGAVVLDKGVASIVASRPGVVAALEVREGERVVSGDPLVSIRSEEDMARGATAPRRMIEALEQQDRRLAAQTSLVMSAAGAEQSRLLARIAGIAGEVASLDNQIADQRSSFP